LIERPGDGAAKPLTKREMELSRSHTGHQDRRSACGNAAASRENDLEIAALLRSGDRH